jgi:hypothetical protein
VRLKFQVTWQHYTSHLRQDPPKSLPRCFKAKPTRIFLSHACYTHKCICPPHSNASRCLFDVCRFTELQNVQIFPATSVLAPKMLSIAPSSHILKIWSALSKLQNHRHIGCKNFVFSEFLLACLRTQTQIFHPDITRKHLSRRFRQNAKSHYYVRHVCLSVRPHRTRLTLDGFFMNFDIWTLLEIRGEN